MSSRRNRQNQINGEVSGFSLYIRDFICQFYQTPAHAFVPGDVPRIFRQSGHRTDPHHAA
jgi:hypothetical protein